MGFNYILLKIKKLGSDKVNWKKRLTNKGFWVAIVSTIIMLSQQLGYEIFPNNWSDILNSILTIFILLGIIIDPSTPGIKDKEENR